MKRFVEGEDRRQAVLIPEYLDDYVADDNPVRVVDVFVDELDLRDLGFDGTAPAATARPSYHPSVLLKIYLRLSQSHSVESSPGTRDATQYRTHVAYGPPFTGFQDRCRLSP